MSHQPRSTELVNPFSTRFIRPGAIDYLFADGRDTEALVRRLADAGWRGQIVGPHGTGKSTLLAALLPAISAAGRPAWTITLRDGQRRLTRGWHAEAQRAGARMIVVDGYEQLSTASRWLLRLAISRRGWGLLVTAHEDVGLPMLYRTSGNLQLAQQLAQRLQRGRPELVSPSVVAEQFTACQGNVRETLFRLYDCYEQAAAGG